MLFYFIVSREALQKVKELQEALGLSEEDLENQTELEELPPSILEELGLVEETEDLDKNCLPGSYEPVLGDCRSYISCGRDGTQQKQECSVGLHWVQSKLTCDWKEFSDCDTVKPRKSYGECNEGEFSPWPGDCGKYRRCVHKKYQEFSCQSGTHWNNKLMVCDHPANAGCSGGGSSSPNAK